MVRSWMMWILKFLKLVNLLSRISWFSKLKTVIQALKTSSVSTDSFSASDTVFSSRAKIDAQFRRLNSTQWPSAFQCSLYLRANANHHALNAAEAPSLSIHLTSRIISMFGEMFIDNQQKHIWKMLHEHWCVVYLNWLCKQGNWPSRRIRYRIFLKLGWSWKSDSLPEYLSKIQVANYG